MKILNKALLVMMVLPAVSFGAENIYLSYEEECRNESPAITNANITACADFASRFALRDIDVMYGQIHATLKERYGEAESETFKRAQAAWVTFRDESCALEGSAVDGPSPMASTCKLGFNIQRIKQLDQLFETIQ